MFHFARLFISLSRGIAIDEVIPGTISVADMKEFSKWFKKHVSFL